MRLPSILLLLSAASQPAAQPHDSASTSSPVIQDNSFLVEEAYNQEAGVVQHIGTYRLNRGTSDFDFGFAQEWPVRSIRHQLSYDIPISRIGGGTGIGDIGINYRYQLTGDGTTRLAVSPRASLILPTGDWKRARGNGAVGVEFNLPVSYVISPVIASHSNIGASTTGSARNPVGDRARIGDWFVGQSFIVTASSIFQPMVEAIYSRGSEVIGNNQTASTETFLIAPGFRAAINFPSGLQVVPGVAFPIGVGASEGERGAFLYLSLEHPFGR